MIKIAPSILSADFSCLTREVKAIESAGANWLHLDIMDGHFVPNLTFGPDVVKSIRNKTKLLFDVHLMINNPEKFIKPFVAAGADIITVQSEACFNLSRILNSIKKFKIKAGVSFNPRTSLNKLKSVLNKVDLVLIMTVNCGWPSQNFISYTLKKIKTARRLIDKTDRKIYLEVDGGINHKTAPLVIKAGADVLVAGSAIFDKKNYKKAIQSITTSGVRRGHGT